MSFDDQSICRLCFATEGNNSEEVFSSIKKYLPFLESLTVISQDESRPQKICPNCEYHIENTQLLRKRIHFTETLWAKYKKQQQETVSDLFLNCHLCGQNFDCQGLRAHITSEHGDNHVSECGFCQTFLDSYVATEVHKTEELMDLETSQQIMLLADPDNTFKSEISDTDESESHTNTESSEHSSDDSLASDMEEAENRDEETMPDEYNGVQIESKMGKKGKLRFRCPICAIWVGRRYVLKRHISNTHNRKDLYNYVSGDRVKSIDRTAQEIKPFCSICDMGFSRKYALSRHMKAKHNIIITKQRKSARARQLNATEQENCIPPPKSLKCPECLLILSQPYALKKHLLDKHDIAIAPDAEHTVTPEDVLCPVCESPMTRKSSLRRHIINRHKEAVDLAIPGHTYQYEPNTSSAATEEIQSEPVSEAVLAAIRAIFLREGHLACALCISRFRRIGTLRKHMRVHGCFHCKRCITVFATEPELLEHQRLHQLFKNEKVGAGQFPCGDCDKSFGSNCNLTLHYIEHLGWKCDRCPEMLSSKAELEDHRKSHLNGVGFPCTRCELVFETVADRKRHVYKEHWSSLCGICGLVVQRLEDHMRIHNGEKPFHCLHEGCGKAFRNQFLLTVHQQTHSDTRPFACDYEGCGMRFRQRRTMLAHRNTHSGEKRYKCQFENCDRSFHGAFDLNLHMRRHTGDKPYLCKGCQEPFYTNSLRRKHQQACGMFLALPEELQVESNAETIGL